MSVQQEIHGWFAGRLPDDWFTEAPEVTVDNDEIVVVGTLPAPQLAADADETTRESAARARVEAHREETRAARMRIADDAQRRFDRKVSWGAAVGDARFLFTTASVPVMTRLRQPERQVLDTLVAAGVARSRSDALAWCVKLVGRHESDWLGELQEAIGHVERARASGPKSA